MTTISQMLNQWKDDVENYLCKMGRVGVIIVAKTLKI